MAFCFDWEFIGSFKGKKRGRKPIYTPEEIREKQKDYQHAYYMRVTKEKRRQKKEAET